MTTENTTTETAPAETTEMAPTEMAPTVEETPDETTPDDEPENTNPAVTKARKEAAKYRERLRDAETQRDTAQSQVEALQKQIIESHATTLGIKPAALWAAGHTIADLTTEEGIIDPETINEAVEKTRTDLGINRFTGSADLGARTTTPASTKPTWQDLTQAR